MKQTGESLRLYPVSEVTKALNKIFSRVAADHGGFELKEYLVGMLSEVGYEVTDFGDHQHNPVDYYLDFVVPRPRR